MAKEIKALEHWLQAKGIEPGFIGTVGDKEGLVLPPYKLDFSSDPKY